MSILFNRILNNFFDKKPSIHFIGIGGTGMSALAGVCLDYGYKVSGSDISYNENIGLLRQKGAIINLYHNKLNVKNCDIVVFSSAVKPDNPELIQAIKANKCVLERHKFLGVLFNCFQKSIAVSGSHGKTTTCGFISQILTEAQTDAQILIGGNLDILNGFNYKKGSECCLAEACEYKRNFLSLKPLIAVVLNIENDHMDYFKDSEDVINAYGEFVSNIKKDGTYITNGDDEACKGLITKEHKLTYGFKKTNDCYAENVRHYKGSYRFNIVFKGKSHKVKLAVYGRHNIYNALAAFCVAYTLGIGEEVIIKAIQNYKGIKRRFECYGKLDGGIPVICDYAHHPSEIAAALKCAREMFKGTVTAVFQPHTYSRTKAFMNEFSKCFDCCDRLILLPVYAAREQYDKEGSSLALYEKILPLHKNAIYLDSFTQAQNYITQNKSCAVLILGAGDVIKLADMLCPKT